MKNKLRWMITGLFLLAGLPLHAQTADFELQIEQITFGPKHHAFGYIGQCLTIPWNQSEQYILGLELDQITSKPDPGETVGIFVLDTHNNYNQINLDATAAWNHQQGTMYYWNPEAPETQFFFNAVDSTTKKIYTVLYDVSTMQRVEEYRYEDTPVANGGICPTGGVFTAFNYGRNDRLRPVTGYKGVHDFTADELAPDDDGVFLIDIATKAKTLLVSYKELEDLAIAEGQHNPHSGLFINHTLWNRLGDRIYFFVRANWNVKAKDKNGDNYPRLNMVCSMHADGSNLKRHNKFIGGHPEWSDGYEMIGRSGTDQIIYDIESSSTVGTLGNPTIFPDPEGDVSLSPDSDWFVNGFEPDHDDTLNQYSVYRMSDGAYKHSAEFSNGGFGGDIRIDPAPRWNRSSNKILVEGLTGDSTRQMHIISVVPAGSAED